jgi:protein-S-isoprenylcysteine O-methyltransferase Ste14
LRRLISSTILRQRPGALKFRSGDCLALFIRSAQIPQGRPPWRTAPAETRAINERAKGIVGLVEEVSPLVAEATPEASGSREMPMNRVIRIALKLGVVVIVCLYIARHIPHAVRAQMQLPAGMLLSVALICLFSVYWSIAAKDSAPTKTSESKWSRGLHLALVNGGVLLLILPVPGLTRRFLPDSRFLVAAGLLVEAAFILLAVWARRALGSNWSGEVRVATGHQLIRSGPYRYIRHPIYTAVLGMYCGVALVSGEIHAPIALVIVALAYWRKIRMEERAMSETFGADHEAYRRDTWALIPFLF